MLRGLRTNKSPCRISKHTSETFWSLVWRKVYSSLVPLCSRVEERRRIFSMQDCFHPDRRCTNLERHMPQPLWHLPYCKLFAFVSENEGMMKITTWSVLLIRPHVSGDETNSSLPTLFRVTSWLVNEESHRSSFTLSFGRCRSNPNSLIHYYAETSH